MLRASGCAAEAKGAGLQAGLGSAVSSTVTVEKFAEWDWFPSGIAISFEPAAEQAPLGFEAWRLHTPFDSHLMVWPDGDFDDIIWWRRMLPVGGGGKRWGEAPDLTSATVEQVKGEGGLTFLLTEGGGRKLVARIVPLDECGHGRALAELSSSVLSAAIGGIQWKDRDLILFYRKSGGRKASDSLSDYISNGEFSMAALICHQSGEALGRFHSDALEHLSLPNDERRWNSRLKELEQRVVSNTLWRAPHSSDTRATTTHRNFGLDSVLIDDDGEVVISNCHDGVPNAILPASGNYPVLRDVAAAYRSIAGLGEQHGISRLEEEMLRKEFFEGWFESAPPLVKSSKALDGHRGGVPIWEYEQVLEEAACAQAWGKEVPDRGIWWLDHVSRIQSTMYLSRTLSAGSLVAAICAVAMPFAEQWVHTFSGRMFGALALAGVAVLLRLLYRMRAPPPY